jgi:hypothetical protein
MLAPPISNLSMWSGSTLGGHPPRGSTLLPSPIHTRSINATKLNPAAVHSSFTGSRTPETSSGHSRQNCSSMHNDRGVRGKHPPPQPAHAPDTARAQTLPERSAEEPREHEEQIDSRAFAAFSSQPSCAPPPEWKAKTIVTASARMPSRAGNQILESTGETSLPALLCEAADGMLTRPQMSCTRASLSSRRNLVTIKEQVSRRRT